MDIYEAEVPEGTISYTTVVVRNRDTGEVFPTNIALAADLQLSGDDWHNGRFSTELSMLESTFLTAAPSPTMICKTLNDIGYELVIEDPMAIVPSTNWDWKELLNG